MNSIPRYLLETHLQAARAHFRGTLLNAGCGDLTYEHLYKDCVDFQVRFDWPKTIHNKSFIDVFGSILELPFANASFETVLCTEVIEHVNDPARALEEMFRVLKPNGHLILSVPFLYQVHEAPFDYFRYTAYGLQHLLQNAGFEIISFKARGGITAVAWFFLRKLIHKMNSKLLGHRIASKIPLTLIDTLYVRLGRRMIADVNAFNTEYCLGYTVVASKPGKP